MLSKSTARLLKKKKKIKKLKKASPGKQQSHFDPELQTLRRASHSSDDTVTLDGAVLVRQAFLPGAEGKREQGKENPPHHQDGPRRAHAGHRPGQFVVQRHLVVAGEQRKHRLVEDQHGEENQDA